MPKFEIEITQTFRTERKITISIEAENRESAIENISSGADNSPSFNDPRWITGWDLQNENVRATN